MKNVLISTISRRNSNFPKVDVIPKDVKAVGHHLTKSGLMVFGFVLLSNANLPYMPRRRASRTEAAAIQSIPFTQSIVSDSSKSIAMKWFPTFLLCVSLQAQAQCEFTEASIETSTDEWGEEMSWILYQSLESGESFPLLRFKGSLMTTTSQTCAWKMAATSSHVGLLGDGWNGGEISCSPTLKKVSWSRSRWMMDTKGGFVPGGDGV